MAALPLWALESGASRTSSEDCAQRRRENRVSAEKIASSPRKSTCFSFHSAFLCASARRIYAAYFCRILSRKRLLSAVTSQALGQKHKSIAHQLLGTPHCINSGMSLSKLSR